jgi:hypothetical protein
VKTITQPAKEVMRKNAIIARSTIHWNSENSGEFRGRIPGTLNSGRIPGTPLGRRIPGIPGTPYLIIGSADDIWLFFKMPWIASVVTPAMPHHVIQQGNRRLQTFFNVERYQAYLELMAEWCQIKEALNNHQYSTLNSGACCCAP